MTKILKRFIDVLDDVGIFLLTVACVFLSSYVLAFKAGTKIDIDWSLGRFLISGLLALMVTAVFELRGIIGVVDTEKVTQIKLAKRKNAWLRVLIGIALGFGAPRLLEFTQKLLGL